MGSSMAAKTSMVGFADPFSKALIVRSETPEISDKSFWEMPKDFRRVMIFFINSFIMCNMLRIFN